MSECLRRIGPALGYSSTSPNSVQLYRRWDANAGALCEFFSAQGLLSEAAPAPIGQPVQRLLTGRRGRAASGRGRHSSQARPAQDNSPQPEPGSLAAIGYDSAQSTALWLQRAGLCSADGCLDCVPGGSIMLFAIQPVVSARLASSAAERSRVLAHAAASSGMHTLQQGSAPFAVPLQSIDTPADARWAAYPGRYWVSRKCDGTRHLLIVAEDGTPYLLNRAGMLYRYPVLSTAGDSGSGASGSGCGGDGSLPPGSILDGELVWVGCSPQQRSGVFLAFDALAVGQQPAWQLHLPQRLQLLESLGLAEAESSPALRAAASAAASLLPQPSAPGIAGGSSSSKGSSPGGSSGAELSKKQQAPPIGRDSVLLLRKCHVPVTAEALEALEASQGACPYPSDGLIFTPAACPYLLGMAELLLKWQLPEQAAADVSGADLQERWRARGWASRSRGRGGAESAAASREAAAEQLVRRLPPALVYECTPLHPPAEPATAATTAQATVEAAAAAGLSRQMAQWRRQEMQRVEEKARSLLLPCSVRWDKRSGNAPAAVDALCRRAARGHYLSHSMLVAAVREAQELVAAAAEGAAGATVGTAPAAATSGTSPPQHPARLQPFAQLYEDVMEEVEAGPVERWVESASGLEVFSYRQELGPPSSPVAAMCRGLVLHPASQAVVATPFVRFPGLEESVAATEAAAAPQALPLLAAELGGAALAQLQLVCRAWRDAISEDSGAQQAISAARRAHEQQAAAGAATRHLARLSLSGGQRRPTPEAEEDEGAALLPGSAADAANRALYSSSGGGAATASLKVDGSLIIAFLWQGRLNTATRRRMDSEQAVWALGWLRQHVPPEALQPGWTYLFEAVYQDNSHVVPYAFEGLVLLSAVAPDGWELCSPAGRQALAARLGVPAPPALRQLLARLSRGTAAAASAAGPAGAAEGGPELAPPTFEGWVLESGGQRLKLVQAAFMRAGAAGLHLHPLFVWDAVRCGGASRQQLATGLPRHMQRELAAILDALTEQYGAVQKAVIAAAPPAANADPVPAEAGHGPEFEAAVRYCSEVGSTQAGPMFLQPSFRYKPGPAPLLRGLLLACCRPGADGSLPGYTPSPAFAQTLCKSWQRSGPAGQRGAWLAALAAGQEAPDTSGISDVAWLVLPHADGRSLVRASLVCKAWRQLVAGDALCQAGIRAAKEEHERAQRQQQLLAHMAWPTWQLRSYSSDDEPYLGWGYRGGHYGSF